LKETEGASPASDTPLRDLSLAEYPRLSQLLDQALDQPPAERAAWLRDLARSEPKSAAVLRELFASQAAAQASGLLEDRELLTRFLESTIEAEPALIGKQIGPYRVLALLGHGGMGSVWLAERIGGSFQRQVALKLIHPALAGQVMTARLGREREILASLHHPHIARLFDAGVAEDGQSYLALEYVAGTSLTSYCDSHRLPIRERLQLFQQVLGAVQYAHAHLVIHRDLKPSNILVTEEGQVQLLDFGIAKLLTEGEGKETQLTQLGGRALTPDYAAPEQIAGAPITIAADVYALGVMLYELLSGERPYRLKRDSRGALEEAILQGDVAPPSQVRPSESALQARATTGRKLAKMLRGDLDTITLKALKKSPAERYPTANAFGEDIARFLRGDVVLAQPDSFAYRTLKFVRRHLIAIAVACALVLTLTGGLAATSYEARVASVQRDAARQAQLRSLTQTAAARLKDADVAGALNIILNVLPQPGERRPYTAEALSVFQQARATDAQLFAITGHEDRVRTAAFSPDGARIVTASYDRTARIWDALTGREIRQLRGHTDWVVAAAFSPDGARIVTASYDRTARLWDAASGGEIRQLRGHTGAVTWAAFSPDGRRIVTASNDKTVRIWDADSGQQLLLLDGHTDVVRTAAFSPDGARVVTASYDKTAGIWDAASGREIRRLRGHTDVLFSAAYSHDGRRIVTASNDQTARVWDAASGQELRLLSGHTNALFSAVFSPDDRRIVTASLDKTARIWDAATGQQILLLSGHTDALIAAAFSPDNRHVVTASLDRTARVWDAASGREILLLGGHTSWVIAAAFSADGRRAVTASADKTARIWDAATGRELLLLSGHTQAVTSAAFSPDGRRVVTASLDRTARIWDALTGRELLLLSGHTQTVNCAAFSPDGRRVVTAGYDKTARVWDAVTGRQLLLLGGHTDLVTAAAFAPDGRRIVTAAYDKTARIWDAATGQQLLLLSGHTDAVNSAAFSADGQRVVTASADKTARIWDAASGRATLQLSGHTDIVESAAFSPDGTRIATASDDRSARIWDAVTGRELMMLNGHTGGNVESAAFSPDGRRVITASYDQTARIWEVRVPSLETQIGWAQAAQFDPLSSAERFQLGLAAPADAHRWPAASTKCDEVAAAPYDPDRRAAGVTTEQIVTDIALRVCAEGSTGADGTARLDYQRGRALVANGSVPAARRDFEDALAHGYRSAAIDLARLLSRPATGMLDVPRAVRLYQQAWKDGVTIAAFDLGDLYEHGIAQGGNQGGYWLAPDESQAWSWYRKAAEAGQPEALARFAEADDDAAFAAKKAADQNASLTRALEYYAAAAERARIEVWPDDVWRNWRYRRASLARLLAQQGMMQEVARVYDGVRQRYAPPPAQWERLLSWGD
jgi:WD40 repeat protein/serine/threonine protein kinase/TPR repeat protein